VPFCEEIHILVKVREQDVLAEILQRHPGVTRQPVGDDFTASLHVSLLTARGDEDTEKSAA